MSRTLRSVAAVAAVAVVGIAAPAAAHYGASRSSSFYVERYLACAGPGASAEVHCVGPIKARAALHAALVVGDLGPGRNHEREVDRAADAAVDASYFAVRDVIPELRVLLRIPIEPRDRTEHSVFDKLTVRAEAAYALAHLGDAASAPAILDLVRELETGFGTTWADTLDALAVLDPARASRYAIEFLDHASDLHMSMPGGSSKLVALGYLRADDRPEAMLADLARREAHGDDHAFCEIMGTRVRLDPAVHADVRKQMLAGYSGTWLAGCAEALLSRLGTEPDDAAVLIGHLGRADQGMDTGVANIAYARVLELIVAMDARWARASEAERASIQRARDVLRRGLVERSGWPHVADPTNRNYSPHFVAFHRAALAGLGDAAARDQLFALTEDPRERSGAEWLAAYWAIRLHLAGAADHASALVRRGVGYRNADNQGVLVDIRARVLDAFATAFPDDPGWTVVLLDGDIKSVASEQALARLSRHAPPRTCDAVTAAARNAQTVAANHALLALTVLGDACLPAIERLANDPGAPSEVRGAALEIAAALESRSLCADLDRARADQVSAPAIERARALHDTRCSSQRP